MAGLSMVDTGGLAAKEKATWKASREADRSTSRTTRLAAGISYRTVRGCLLRGGARRSFSPLLAYIVGSRNMHG